MTERWSAIERIFHAALDRPVEARAAFLAEACAGDEILRREVQSLLDQASMPGFLGQPALEVAAGLVTSASLAPLTGQQLGVYRMTALLGRGGMGEVYRARDTRLGREVAIKVLPQALTGNPDRLARLEREARMLASLNHPNIGMLHGLEESGGHLALILELIEGETLAERLVRGPVPMKLALTWARQIAEALDAAHEKGIVHRDLKPANVKITPEDVVKVLDFGLARTFAGGIDGGEHAQSPTITMEGAAIIGTAAYMSPEQARGQAVDKRADVWAFGCVLYELLTGRMVFARATMSDTLTSVLHGEPDWTLLPVGVPPAVTTLLRRCLEKDVRQRRRDIGDVRAELEDAIAARVPGAPSESSEHPPPARRVLRVTLVAAAVIVAAALGTVANRWWFGASPDRAASSEPRFKRITDAVGMEEMPAVSPDGKDVVFVARIGGKRQIWFRRLNGGQPLQITHDDVDHEDPRWTPDSSSIVYFTPSPTEGEAGTLSEMPAPAGRPTRLADVATSADVSHDGRWLATFQRIGQGMTLALLARDGVTPGRTIPLDGAEFNFSPPRWSPDDRSIAFSLGQTGFSTDVFVIDVATRTSRVVHQATSTKGLAWLPDGTGLVVASSVGSTMVYPPVFNLRLVPLDGSRERQLTFGDVSYEHPDIDKAGQIFASRTLMKSDIWRFPVAGSAVDNVRDGAQITRQTGQVRTPSVSPDGKEIAYLSDSGGHSNVWIAKVDGSETPRPLTTETEDRVVVGIPLWSPVGDRIVYIRDDRTPRGGGLTEWLINRDGSDRRALVKGAGATWSPDGQWLYYAENQGQFYKKDSPTCISKVRVSGPVEPVRVRCDASVPAVGEDGTLYFVPRHFQYANEIHKVRPESTGVPQFLTKHLLSRVPLWPTGFALSPNDLWLAVPLKDAGTTNIWAISTDRGIYRQITDFGRRPTLIARQVSWSRDGKFIFAALVETDADIALLTGLIAGR